MPDVQERARVKLTGQIDLTIPGLEPTQLTAVEISREDAVYHMKIDGTMNELRKLAKVAPAYAHMLEFVADAAPDAKGSLTLKARDDLAREMRAAEPADALPNEWITSEAWAKLAFAFDRYEPESVGRVISETSSS